MIILCKTCRRLGVSVCGKEHCALQRKPYPPGTRGGRKRGRTGRGRTLSDYGRQLREKQILKFLYNLREKQFRNYVTEAISSKKKNSPEELISILESRLDNVVYRMGLSRSRTAARQIVSHGHIYVNDRKVNIPSFRTRTGDVISVRPNSRDKGVFRDLEFYLKKHNPPMWLALDKDKLIGTVEGAIHLEDVDVPANINAIVEFYSR